MNFTQAPVTVFVPCLVENFFPEIAHSAIAVIERLGFRVVVKDEQLCCGQPGFNSGFQQEAAPVAARTAQALAGAKQVVCLSGSCTVMLNKWLPDLLTAQSAPSLKPQVSYGHVQEFVEFLYEHDASAHLSGRRQSAEITATSANQVLGYHQSCHCYRELGQRCAPLDLLQSICSVPILVPPGEPECCGFGGTFSVKLSAVAQRMSKQRLQQFQDLGVHTIITADPGCIFQMRKEIQRHRFKMEVVHIAQIIDQATL